MQIIGTIAEIKDSVQVTPTFKKRELWLNIPGKYPQTVPIEFNQDIADILDNYSIGEEVDILFDLRGRVHKERCYLSLSAWKIIAVVQPNNSNSARPQVSNDGIDDLPF